MRSSTLNQEKLELLHNAPWGIIYPKLVSHAEWEIDKYSWRAGSLPKGHTAESIVQEAIQKTLSEDRNWDPERGELLPWLKWVIRGEIDHLYHSASHPEEYYILEADSFEDNPPAFEKLEYDANRQLPDGHEAKSAEERTVLAETTRRKLDSLLEACDGRPELEEVVEALIGNKCSPEAKSLAEYFGRPVEEIYQRLRALRRRAAKIGTEWTKHGQE